MNPEQARKLRDEIRHRSSHHQPGLGQQPGSDKQHLLYFDEQRPEQAAQVHQLLDGIEGLKVSNPGLNRLQVEYNLTEYTLEGLENALASQGFALDTSMFHRMRRVLIYFWEETQQRNMRVPQRLIKKSNEIYVKAWEQHPHGDHDETPTDLRDER